MKLAPQLSAQLDWVAPPQEPAVLCWISTVSSALQGSIAFCLWLWEGITSSRLGLIVGVAIDIRSTASVQPDDIDAPVPRCKIVGTVQVEPMLEDPGDLYGKYS